MSDILIEHSRGQNLRQSDIDWFASNDVPAINLAKTARGEFSFVVIDRVVFLPSDRFEFAHYLQGAGEAVTAYVMVARDVDGVAADIIAWHPRTCRVALWRGAVAMAGEEQIYAPRLEHLTVHEDVLAWLQAGREGVVIFDTDRAARLFDGCGPLLVGSVDHGKRLRKQLTIPSPEILVSQAEEAAA